MTAEPFQIPDAGVVEFSILSENPIPEILPGRQVKLKHKGNELDKSGIYQFLPFLSVYVSNRSNCNSRIQIGSFAENGFSVDAKKGRGLSDIPFIDLTIYNLDETETIKEGEIIITCVNDTTSRLKYVESVMRGISRPLKIPPPQLRRR